MVVKAKQIELLQRAMETIVFEELWHNYTEQQLDELIAELSNCERWGDVVDVLTKHQDQLIDNF